MKKATQNKIIETLESVRDYTKTTLNDDSKYAEMIAEIKAIECEPDYVPQFNEKVLVSDDNRDFTLRCFKEMNGDKFKCFVDGKSSKQTEKAASWRYMKRCLIFKPYTGVKPELREGEAIYIRFKIDSIVTYGSIESIYPAAWNDVVDYCIFKV